MSVIEEKVLSSHDLIDVTYRNLSFSDEIQVSNVTDRNVSFSDEDPSLRNVYSADKNQISQAIDRTFSFSAEGPNLRQDSLYPISFSWL